MNKISIYIISAFLVFGTMLSAEAYKLSDSNQIFFQRMLFELCPKNDEISYDRVGVPHFMGWSEIGLTDEMVEKIVIGRLRAEGLYGRVSETTADLLVEISVYQDRFDISLRYRRKLYDPDTLVSGFATTWDESNGGTHGGSKYFVLSVLLELFDQFMEDYLHVRNSEECKALKSISP